MEPEIEPTAPKTTKPRLWVLVLVVLVAGVAGFLLLRRSAPPSPVASPAIQQGSPDALIQGSPVLLNAKAAIIADRYNCLCGECADTLGKCICTRDKGSNEMKATLNRLAEEKKTLAEIDAAMVDKYGAKVMVSGAPAAPASSSK
ncbi:MAG TPA: hypothetical protein VFW45_06190 [Candidatus Polarisedimenticolia bacterium]|nr:hypothetical protein [Candidatus Polarisedimenticolia bacterium]